MTNTDVIVEVSHLKTYLGNSWVHTDVNLDVIRGEILAIVGGSGSGKTTLLREMLGLLKPTSGIIKIFSQKLNTASVLELLQIQRRWGVLFQQKALFSSLTVLENVAFPLKEHTALPSSFIEELAMLKIELVGLRSTDAIKYPAELSGGMQKRAALARAIILDPELLFLDEPTSGLDPESAAAFDELILDLQTTLDLTVVMVTHDVDSLWTISNRVAFLGDGKVLDINPMEKLISNPNPIINAFFKGPRGRAAEKNHQH